MTKILAFGAELARVDALEEILIDSANAGRSPRDTAVLIESILSRPQDGFGLRQRVADAILHADWASARRTQSLHSIIRQFGIDGALIADGGAVIGRITDAAITELRLPSVEMVDAGQAEIDGGAKSFMRIWLKAWEKA